MREILFRGKRIIGGEWVYGSLLTDNSGEKHIIPFKEIYMDGHHVCIESDWPQFFDQQTIGQFTGLTDKNGVEIFEGDIVLTEGHSIGVIRYLSDEALFAVNFPSRLLSLRNATSEYIEVIGNIQDNPPELFS